MATSQATTCAVVGLLATTTSNCTTLEDFHLDSSHLMLAGVSSSCDDMKQALNAMYIALRMWERPQYCCVSRMGCKLVESAPDGFALPNKVSIDCQACPTRRQ